MAGWVFLVHPLSATFPLGGFPFVPVGDAEISGYNGPGQSADHARKVVVSSSGRIYWMGQSIDVGVQNSLFIRCHQPDGTLLWSDARKINGFRAQDLLVDKDDNAFVVARAFNQSALVQSHDVGILKYDSKGVSTRSEIYLLDYQEPAITPFYNQNAPSASVLGDNGILYISGYVSDESFGEPSPVSHPLMFAVNTAGFMSLDWVSDIHNASSLPPYFQEVPVAIALTPGGDIYEVSNFGTRGNGVTLRKVSPAGRSVWEDSVIIPTFRGRRHQAIQVGVAADGGVLVSGKVETTETDDSDVFVARFNPTDGAVVWVKTFRFGEGTELKAARVAPDGSVIGVGSVNFNGEWLAFRVSAQGGLVWDQRFDIDSAAAVTVESDQTIFVVGTASGFPSQVAVVKYSEFGQVLWAKTLENLYGLPHEKSQPPSIAVARNGSVFVTGHRNFADSEPDEWGASYPIYDAALYRITPSLTEAPLVRFLTPTEGQTVSSTSPLPRITVQATSAVGIQKIVLYDRQGDLLTVLTNAPYEVTLPGLAREGSVPLYAVAFDNSGYAGIAQVAPVIESTENIIELEASAYRVLEGQGSVRIAARRSSIRGRASVTVRLVPGTASLADFSHDAAPDGLPGSFQLIFVDGEEFSVFDVITIEKDTAAEADEVFTVELSNPSTGRLGTLKNATITIVDDDSGRANPAGKISFGEFSYLVTEEAGQVQLSLVRTGGTEGPVSVNYFTQPTQPITALPNADYLERRGTVRFAAGETSQVITAYVLKDNQTESAESFYVTLLEPENGATLGLKGFTLVQIRQNQAPTNTPTISNCEQWRKLHFPEPEPEYSRISGDLADPDGDGVVNLVECAVGSNPRVANAGNYLKTQISSAGDETRLEVTLIRPKGLVDISYIFEVAHKLGLAPCDTCAQTSVIDNGNGTETVRLQVVMPLDQLASAFVLFKLQRR